MTEPNYPRVLLNATDVLDLIDDPKRRATYHVMLYPDAAAALLAINRRPRRLDSTRVDKHVKAIRDGRWLCTTSGFGIDTEGDLTNGQHRLNACVKSGRAIEIFIHTGMDPATRYVEDTGRTRSFADTLTIAFPDKPASTVDSSAARLLHRYLNADVRDIGRAATVDNDTLLRYVEQVLGVERLHQVGLVGKRARKHVPGANSTSFAAFCYLATDVAGHGEAHDRFLDGLISGADLHEYDGGYKDPQLVLRNLLANAAARSSSTRVNRIRSSAPIQLLLIIKAFNAYLTDGKLKQLGIREDESQPRVIAAVR